jgi:hypothetical protein
MIICVSPPALPDLRPARRLACPPPRRVRVQPGKSLTRPPDNQFPRLGPLTGAGMLTEIRGDRSGFTGARRLKAYAGPRQSPAPAAAAFCATASRTSASLPPVRPGPSPLSPLHPAPTTIADATSATGSSATSTSAWPPASPTTKPPPSPRPAATPRPPQLDNNRIGCRGEQPGRMKFTIRDLGPGFTAAANVILTNGGTGPCSALCGRPA